MSSKGANSTLRPHKQTAAILLIACYISAALFFAVVRAFGLMWFQQEYVETSLPEWGGAALLFLFYVFDYTVALRTLTELSWKVALIIAVLLRSILFVNATAPYLILIDVAAITLIPLAANRDKERGFGWSLLYMVCIGAYQAVMMFGRGYPILNKFSPSWQILLTIDYRMFLFGLYILKGAIGMFYPGPGCMLFVGKFDNFARKIGSFLLNPFTRHHDA